jgi:hypothetical protein
MGSMTTNDATPIASARGLVKTYGTGDTAVHASPASTWTSAAGS